MIEGNRVKICLISEEYPTPSTGKGGIGTYTYTLAHSLSKLGESVFVISRSTGVEEEYREGSVVVCRIPPLCFSIPFVHAYLNIFGYSLAVNKKLKQFIEERGIEIVEAPEYAAEAFFFSRTKRVPLVIRLHTPHIVIQELSGTKPGTYSRIIRWMEKETVTHAHVITSPSRRLAELCQHEMGFKQPFSVIPNPVDISQFAEVDYQSRLSDQLILYVGKFQDIKNVKVLIQALPEVVKRFSQVKLRLIGSDTRTGLSGSSYRKEMEKLARDLCIEQHVEFFDMIPRKELTQHYQRARVAVIPSHFENFPYTCLEAMSCGCPVIASRVGGLTEMIEEGVSGLLFQKDDAFDLSEKIATLLSDADLAGRMGDAAALRARRNYAEEIVVPKILEVYRRLLIEAHKMSK